MCCSVEGRKGALSTCAAHSDVRWYTGECSIQGHKGQGQRGQRAKGPGAKRAKRGQGQKGPWRRGRPACVFSPRPQVSKGGVQGRCQNGQVWAKGKRAKGQGWRRGAKRPSVGGFLQGRPTRGQNGQVCEGVWCVRQCVCVKRTQRRSPHARRTVTCAGARGARIRGLAV